MAAYAVRRLDHFLLGDWELARAVHDLAGGALGEFEGTATFRADAADPHLLHYYEEGVLRLGEHEGTAFRRLRYLVDGPRARVEFEDGRFFHKLDLSAGEWSAVHPCRADEYTGRFGVETADAWWQEWTVRGPAKAYVLRSSLTRCRPGRKRTRVRRSSPAG